MWISVQGLEKKLKKLIDEEYNQDCYVYIEEFKIVYYDGSPQVTISGNYGVTSDSKDDVEDLVWFKEFKLDFSYKYLNDVSFIKGMLCQYIYEKERID
jgi:hypothetical protein